MPSRSKMHADEEEGAYDGRGCVWAYRWVAFKQPANVGLTEQSRRPTPSITEGPLPASACQGCRRIPEFSSEPASARLEEVSATRSWWEREPEQ